MVRIRAIMMLKAPRPGRVKTRLGRDVGDDEAARIYRVLVGHQLRELPAHWECAVHYAPDDAAPEMEAWLRPLAPAGVVFRPQCAGDLGARMLHAVRTELANGAEAVVLLGGDCPMLTRGRLVEIEAPLRQGGVVVAPAADGGYVLLGLRAAHECLFRGMPWGGPEVLARTVEAARASGIPLVLHGGFEDVDDLASLRRLDARGRLPPDAMPRGLG